MNRHDASRPGPVDDPLPDAATLADRLGARVVVHDVVESTMTTARRDDGSIPAVHLAERQRGGRGRHERGWASPPGNLHATVVWPDPEGAIPPAVLAAIQLGWSRAIGAAGGPRTTCKWPNDGLLDGAKWAGTLAVRHRGSGGSRLLVGLGANLTVAPELADDDRATIALGERWDPWPGRRRVVPLLLSTALGVLREGPRAITDALTAWDRRDALASGEPIRVETSAGSTSGRYAGVSPDGRLLLERAGGGETLAFTAGEVVRLDRPSG